MKTVPSEMDTQKSAFAPYVCDLLGDFNLLPKEKPWHIYLDAKIWHDSSIAQFIPLFSHFSFDPAFGCIYV